MAKQNDASDSDNDSDSDIDKNKNSAVPDKKASRKQHKEAVKAQKRERRLKREGNASADVGRKTCDLCTSRVDLLVRCTIDETQQYKMVCGKCWPDVSGGVPDGVSSTHPHYNYGGLWKNRNANLKKKVGSGLKKSADGVGQDESNLLEEIAELNFLPSPPPP